MIGLLLSLVAFIATFWAGRKSLGHGLGSLFLFGYFYGIARANFPDGRSHFMFDMALLGLYLAVFVAKRGRPTPREARLKPWISALIAWPVLTIFLSVVTPSQHVLIQIVGLRVAILMLPLLVLGARLDEVELLKLGRWILWLNALAFGMALLELGIGVERFFPENEVTEIIYISTDVGASRQFRIPSSFSSAHAYSGTMLLSLPVLAWMWMEKKLKPVFVLGVILMTVMGLFISGARSPVAQLGIAAFLFLVSGRVQMRTRVAAVFASLVLTAVVLSNERFQRILTLTDSAAVEQRLAGSFNQSLFDVVTSYPLGAGLGGANGTSIPFFLAHLASPQMGLENEFARIALEQGIIGLVLWLAFLGWFFFTGQGQGALGREAGRFARALVLVLWFTAFIGTGLLASIPGSAFLVLWMGLTSPVGRRVQSRPPGRAPGRSGLQRMSPRPPLRPVHPTLRTRSGP